MSVVSIGDLLLHLNRAQAGDDATELQATLDAAERVVVSHCGAFGSAAATYSVWASPGQMTLILPATRLAGVSGVRDPRGTAATLYGDDAKNLLSGIVRIPYSMAGAWSVDVTTSATVPADLKLAVLIVAGHLWETQRAPGAPAPGFGAAIPQGFSAGYAIPNRALDLMRPYMLPSFA